MKCLLLNLVLISSCRPPHGGRGLKSFLALKRRGTRLSPPARGAWIEMANLRAKAGLVFVAPRTGGVD